MAHNTTVFRQLLDLLPRHEFDAEARQHQEGQRLRVMSRWAQFVALGLGQLGGLQSLRDIVGNLRAQPHKLYHLGVRAFVSRSSLARVNAQQPYTLYEALFGRLLARCQQRAPRHGFRFKNNGFGDEHVNAIIRQAMAVPSFTLVIVDPSPKSPFVTELRKLDDRRVWLATGPAFGTLAGFVDHAFPDLRDEDIRKKVLATHNALATRGTTQGGFPDGA